jgi:hypothetical protein
VHYPKASKLLWLVNRGPINFALCSGGGVLGRLKEGPLDFVYVVDGAQWNRKGCKIVGCLGGDDRLDKSRVTRRCKDHSKFWAGSGHPCTKEDMDIFYAVTTITIGNGCKTPFWEAPWLGGRKPIDIAPLFAISNKKTFQLHRRAP